MDIYEFLSTQLMLRRGIRSDSSGKDSETNPEDENMILSADGQPQSVTAQIAAGIGQAVIPYAVDFLRTLPARFKKRS